MTNEEYRRFWERFLGRYPDFKPTIEQTEDWRRELIYKNAILLEAAVSTVIIEKSSQQPRLPWFLNAYYKVKQKRDDEERENKQPVMSDEEERESIRQERLDTLNFLKKTTLEDLRKATRIVLKKYSNVLDKPKDGNVEDWSVWLRAAVYLELKDG